MTGKSSNHNAFGTTATSSKQSCTTNMPVPQSISAAVSKPEGVNGTTANGTVDAAPTINRKKQKRRQKQAARLAAEQSSAAGSTASQVFIEPNATAYRDLDHAMSATQNRQNGYNYGPSEYDDPEYEPGEGEDLYYTDDDDRLLEKPYATMRANGITHDQPIETSSGRSRRKKKNKSSSPYAAYPTYDAHGRPYPDAAAIQQRSPPPPPPALSNAALRSAHHISKDRIWNTSTAEERQRIKEFWLSLGEEDRRSLVKVEKEAVLKKMKEQQKHSCSCTVCGRKRTAIEEELEVLYDAYYEELEQYANHQQINLDDGTPIVPPARMYGHPMGRMPPSRIARGYSSTQSSSGRIQEIQDDEEDGDDEEYDEEEDDDVDISDGEPEEPMGPGADFFNFGNSLTVQGKL